MADKLNVWKIIIDSGPVAKVVLLILMCASFYSWSIIFNKRRTIKALKLGNDKFLDSYNKNSNLHEVFKEAREMTLSPCAILFRKGYEELLRISDKIGAAGQVEPLQQHFALFGLESLERALKQGANEVNEKLESFLSPLASIGSISPFIGLFGTVWGIIHSFTGLSSGDASLDAVAPGIAEALVATAVGLLAAIPAVIFYNYFTQENAKLNTQMESFGQNFLNMVERSLVSRKS